jgi:glutamate 5-kinase
LAYVRPTLARASTWGSAKKPKKMSFGDNDQLASILASKLEAELLVLLTDVDAVYDKNPNKHADAQPIKEWTVDTEVNSEQDAGAGRGGMRSKIRSASQAARAGCTAVIASGRDGDTLQRLFSSEPPGTWFPPVGMLSQKHQWIAMASSVHGVLVVNDRATARVRTERASVYATDIVQVEGDFAIGQVVEVRDQHNVLLGRGATSYPSDIARAWSNDPHETHAKRDVVVIRWDQLTQEPTS